MLIDQQFYLFGQIQTSQTGGQPYSDPSPYGNCSMLDGLMLIQTGTKELRNVAFICVVEIEKEIVFFENTPFGLLQSAAKTQLCMGPYKVTAV